MIISRQLEEGKNLLRGKETLKIKQLIRTGRSCTAVVTNGKGKEERLTITDMWNQKIILANSVKEIPKEAKKKVVEANPKAKISSKEEPLMAAVVTVERAGGIATYYYTNKGPIRSSWQRNKSVAN